MDYGVGWTPILWRHQNLCTFNVKSLYVRTCAESIDQWRNKHLLLFVVAFFVNHTQTFRSYILSNVWKRRIFKLKAWTQNTAKIQIMTNSNRCFPREGPWMPTESQAASFALASASRNDVSRQEARYMPPKRKILHKFKTEVVKQNSWNGMATCFVCGFKLGTYFWSRVVRRYSTSKHSTVADWKNGKSGINKVSMKSLNSKVCTFKSSFGSIQ